MIDLISDGGMLRCYNVTLLHHSEMSAGLDTNASTFSYKCLIVFQKEQCT